MSHGMIRFIATLILACLSLTAQGVEEVIYYHNDALGSPIIATDQEGRVVWRKSYAPYGQPIGQAAPDEPGYTGKFEEPDLGIQYFGARWYDPRIGRFLAVDPAGFDPQNSQSFNRYAYANNNPYKHIDPDGRVPIDTIWDAGNVVYDVFTGNWADAGADAAAILIPYVPAGITKLRHVDDAAEAIGEQAAKGTVKADAVVWPPNRGFDGDPARATLIPGARVDRYGGPNGTFVSPDGTPFPLRSLPEASASKPLNTYEVLKPIEVDAGSSAPWFKQPGGGIQFELPRSAQELLDAEYLRQVE